MIWIELDSLRATKCPISDVHFGDEPPIQCSGLHFSEPDERPNTHPASTLTMISTNYSLALFTTKTVPNDADRSTHTSNPTRKRKADVALGRPVGSPLKHRGRTDSFNAGHLRGQGFDRYDLDGLCIFDSLALDGLTMLHDEKGEAHLIVPNAGGAIGAEGPPPLCFKP